MEQKIVFVGEARICKQVAYVLDYQDYELTEKITDLNQYQDYEIYICKFRRKGKIKTKNKNLKIYYLEDICKRIDAEYAASQQPIKQIAASVKEDKVITDTSEKMPEVNDTPEVAQGQTKLATKSIAVKSDVISTSISEDNTNQIEPNKQIKNIEPEVVTEISNGTESKPVTKEPFLKKTWRRLTHPIQTIKKGCLHLKWWLVRRYYDVKKVVLWFYYHTIVWFFCRIKSLCNRIRWWFIHRFYDLKKIILWIYFHLILWLFYRVKSLCNRIRWWFIKRYYDIKKMFHHIRKCFISCKMCICNHEVYRIKKIEKMTPSQLFLYVLFSKPDPRFDCDFIEKRCYIYSIEGMHIGCCSIIPRLPIINNYKSLDEIYHNVYARIIKLSSLNRSYCLCQHNLFCFGYKPNHYHDLKELKKNLLPEFCEISIGHSCNLACKSCRKEHYIINKKDEANNLILMQRIYDSNWLNRVAYLRLFSEGETFYNLNCREMLFSDQVRRKQVQIFSNGTLFNETNWNLVKNKYENISVALSIDAVTEATYKKIRGGNWQALISNLRMLGNLRRENKIKNLEINFVVQEDNYLEMIDFVHFCKANYVDEILFLKLNHWYNSGYLSVETLQKDLIIKDKYLNYQLYKILKNSIFQDPIVNLGNLQYYLDNSEKKYRRRYLREQNKLTKR